MGSYRLELEPQKQNVFVTQLRDDEEEQPDIRKFPIVTETAGKLLETGLQSLQSTLLLKREVEVERVQQELEEKRREFKERMEKCKEKEEELKRKQQQIRERVEKFDKFIQENEAKRRRAIQKYQTESKLKTQKTSELENLQHELELLKKKKEKLEIRRKRYSIYEKYLLRVLDNLPEDYGLEMSDSMLTSIMMRFKTLSATNKSLLNQLSARADMTEQKNQVLSDLEQEHTQQVLVYNSELAELQDKLESSTQTKNKLEEMVVEKRNAFRQQSEILGQIKLSIDNILDTCCEEKQRKQALSEESFDEKLKFIMEVLLDFEDICHMASTSDNSVVSLTPDTHTGLTSSILKRGPQDQTRASKHTSFKTSNPKTPKSVQISV